jgi:hypothetical protein
MVKSLAAIHFTGWHPHARNVGSAMARMIVERTVDQMPNTCPSPIGVYNFNTKEGCSSLVDTKLFLFLEAVSGPAARDGERGK